MANYRIDKSPKQTKKVATSNKKTVKEVAAKKEAKSPVKKTEKKTQITKPEKRTRREMFTKDMTLGEVLMKRPEAQAILCGFGMHCFSCPCALGETLEEAAKIVRQLIDFALDKARKVNL